MTRKSKLVLIFSSIVVLSGMLLFYLLRFSPYKKLDLFLADSWSVSFYDSKNVLLQVTPVENGIRREFLPIAQIPQSCIDLFLLAEDKRFYSHGGVDWISAGRAFIQNVLSKERVSGASTITMQLARIIEPSAKRNWSAKIKDVWNAHRLESRFTKNQILELYLNRVPFGFSVEGVVSASRYFFSQEIDELSDLHFACLAVIPRRPASYNPITNPTICQSFALPLYEQYAIETHQEISQSDIEKRVEEAVISAKQFSWPFQMPHLIRLLSNNKMTSGIEKSNPYKIILSADSQLQQFAQFQLENILSTASDSRIHNGAVVVLDVKTGEVLAWVGSHNWFDTKKGGQLDGVLVPNQMGSSMKPFLYALSLETKTHTTTDVLPDIPMEFGSHNMYIPMNFNNRYNGPVLFRPSLASSLNVPSVMLLDEIGVDYYLDTLFNLGFLSLKQGGLEADLGLALGAGEVTLLELTNGFSVFPRDGRYFSPSFIKGAKEESHEVFSADTARIICDILSDKAARVAGFGYSQSFQTSYPSIFKTGTANQYQNIVAIGGTPKYAVGVWMGNFSGSTVMGKTGSSLPATVARSILDFLTEKDGEIPSDFNKPQNWEKVPVCSVSGMAPSHLCSTVYEYVEKTEKDVFQNKVCTWHIKDENGKISITYPAQYQQWFRTAHKTGSLSYNSSSLSIISPSMESVFYLDPVASFQQRIPVEVIGGLDDTQPLQIFYDGEVYTEKGRPLEVNRPFIFSVPVEKGSHEIVVVLGDETASVTYLVE